MAQSPNAQWPGVLWGWMLRRSVAFAVVVVLATSCEPPRKDVRQWRADDHEGARGRAQTPQNTANKDASVGLANTLWNKTCATCHGARGIGDGPFAPENTPDLTRPEWLATVTDDDLRKVIREGRNKMPANPDLPDNVLDALVRKIRATGGNQPPR